MLRKGTHGENYPLPANLYEIRAVEKRFLPLLLAGHLTELESLGDGDGLTAAEIALALARLGAPLADCSGQVGRRCFTVKRSGIPSPIARWSVTRDLNRIGDDNPRVTLTYTVLKDRAFEVTVNIDEIALKSDHA